MIPSPARLKPVLVLGDLNQVNVPKIRALRSIFFHAVNLKERQS
jgi:hypothetical protein